MASPATSTFSTQSRWL